MRRRAAVLAAAALMLGGAGVARANPCEGVDALHVPDVRIDRATPHGPQASLAAPYEGSGPVTTAFCRIEGTIEREIGFELWLPERAAWNRRLLVGGVGGQAGQVNLRELVRGVRRGYASASTDAGHKAEDKHWLLRRPDRAANYAHRANHLLAIKSKALIAAVYRSRALHAFFVGCSGGGRQALTEVQRYPADFDGVIAGAPGVNTPEMSARRMWEMQRHSEWGASVPASVWTLTWRAAIQQCDPRDGIIDGVVANPRACRFDPASLLCRPGKAGPDCLTPAQVTAVRRLTAPLVDENGKRIDAGLLPTAPVSPAPLPEPFTPGPSYLATVLFGDGVHADAAWDARTFSLARDLPAINRVMDLHADDPKIEPFVARGGKLILYQGWDDPLVSATSTLDYWNALSGRFGAHLGSAVRLFMAPGVDHCRGGPGPDLFGGAGGDAPIVDERHDLLSALEAWTLAGRAPERIVATKLDRSGPVRTRPLCAWPAQAAWTGTGSTDDAANFTCRRG